MLDGVSVHVCVPQSFKITLRVNGRSYQSSKSLISSDLETTVDHSAALRWIDRFLFLSK